MNRPRNALLVTLAVALLLRAGYDVVTAGRPLRADETSYDAIAWNVASGHGYAAGATDAERVPTAIRGPGYVLPLAFVYRVAGHRPDAMRMLQAVLDTLCAWLVWRIGRRLFGDPWLALGGAAVYALYPPFILDAGQVVTEGVTNLTVLAGLDFGLGWALGGPALLLPASGVMIGLCALAKPQLAPVAVLVVLAARPSLLRRDFWTAALLQVAVVSAVLAPWIVRNAVVFHAFVPGVTLGGVTFWGGTGPADGRTLGGLDDPRVPVHVRRAVAGLSERERDRWLYAEGARVIRQAPGRWAGLLGRKLVRLWFNLLYDDPPSRASLALAGLNLAVLLLAALAIVRLRPPPVATRLLAWLVAWFSVVHVAFFAVVRYAMPCYAYIACFAGAALVAFWLRSAGPAPNGTRAVLPTR